MLDRNEKINVYIEDLNHEGHGVGKAGNFVVFVPGAIPGETVEAIIIKPGKNYAVGKMTRIPRGGTGMNGWSEPACEYYPRCGGCNLLHMTYEAQLKFKEGRVADALSRIGKLKNVEVLPIIGMEDPAAGYRNKAQFPVGRGKDGRPLIGFYAPRSHRIVDSDNCGIHHPACDRVRAVVRRFIEEAYISIYDEEKHAGLLRHIVVRVGVNTGEVMVILVINGRRLPGRAAEALAERLKAEVKGFRSL